MGYERNDSRRRRCDHHPKASNRPPATIPRQITATQGGHRHHSRTIRSAYGVRSKTRLDLDTLVVVHTNKPHLVVEGLVRHTESVCTNR